MKRNIERADIKEWLLKLDEASKRKEYGPFWKSIYKRVYVSRRRRISVNVSKINEYSKEGDNIIVPGKVLSQGKMDHSINITAISFSEEAKKKLKDSDSKTLSLDDMIKCTKINIIR